MRIFNHQVFDDVIVGAGKTWYSQTDMNAELGTAFSFAVQANTSWVSGTLPTLTVKSEHSPDSENWIATGVTEISAVALVNNGTFFGSYFSGVLNQTLGRFIRFNISLGGTAPQCRLKLYVTGHDTI